MALSQEGQMDRGLPLLALTHAPGGKHQPSLTLYTMALNESLLLEKIALIEGSLSHRG